MDRDKWITFTAWLREIDSLPGMTDEAFGELYQDWRERRTKKHAKRPALRFVPLVDPADLAILEAMEAFIRCEGVCQPGEDDPVMDPATVFPPTPIISPAPTDDDYIRAEVDDESMFILPPARDAPGSIGAHFPTPPDLHTPSASSSSTDPVSPPSRSPLLDLLPPNPTQEQMRVMNELLREEIIRSELRSSLLILNNPFLRNK